MPGDIPAVCSNILERGSPWDRTEGKEAAQTWLDGKGHEDQLLASRMLEWWIAEQAEHGFRV